MPVSVSLNRQQNSEENFHLWYYNAPSVFRMPNDFGSIEGGNKVTLVGQNFKPFDWSNDIDNQNDTFCSFGALGKVPAQVLSQTEAECISPANPQHLTTIPVKFTINNQNYTDEEFMFTFYNPPNVVDTEPLIGSVNGGTVVNFWGSTFEKRNITCMFGSTEVKGTYISKQHLTCLAPPQSAPGDYRMSVKYSKDRFQSDNYTFTYFASPVVSSLSPACGPVEGYTQMTIRGRNFLDFGFGRAKCIFNESIWMNATILDSNTIVCDSPMLEPSAVDMFYNVSVTLDGQFFSNSTGTFNYYRNPTITNVAPWTGPTSGGTNSTISGHGFNQTNICNLMVRYEQTHIVPFGVQENSV